MDSHHHLPTLHALAGLASGGQQQQHDTKQHPMGQFQQQQQPLVNTNNSQTHQLLHFHHSPNSQQQQQQQPYSTLSHLNLSNQQQQQAPHLNLMQHLNSGHGGLFNSSTLHHPTSSQNSAASSSGHSSSHSQHHLQNYFNTHHHHHHPHQHAQQHHPHPPHLPHTNHHLQQQQQLFMQHSGPGSQSTAASQPGGAQGQPTAAYNMNSSDYSSSTYHVYDQILGDQIIDDLIVIKQERMKKKREQEQKIKVILIGLAAILLVGLLMFLIVQLFKVTATTSSPSLSASNLRFDQQQQATTSNNNDLQQQQQQSPYVPPFVYPRPHWAPPIGGQTNKQQPQPDWDFDPNQMQRNPQVLQPPALDMPQPPPPSPTHNSHAHHQHHQNQLQHPHLQHPNNLNRFLPPVISSSSSGVLAATSAPALPASSRLPAVDSQTERPLEASGPESGLTVANSNVMSAGSGAPARGAGAAAEPAQDSQAAASGTQSSQEQQATASTSDISNNHNNNNLRGCHGRHCPPAGCPNNCSQRGQCVNQQQQQSAAAAGGGQGSASAAIAAAELWLHQQAAQEWRCQCAPGSTGDDCSILIERQCDDGLDNDKDGLVDCADSECCGDQVCQNSTLCMKSPDPLDILMRKQPPPPTSSFFKRMEFLIEKSSSQYYTSSREFNESILTSASKYFDRASVLRGRVTYQKQGVIGVRVSIAGQRNIGITLTRDGGYYDLMVNGGGAVTVEFLREPFATLQKTVRVPWNEIVLVDAIELQLAESPTATETSPSSAAAGDLVEPISAAAPIVCSAHNYRLLRPTIVAAPSSIRRPASSSSSHHLHAHTQPPRPQAIFGASSHVLLPAQTSTSSSQLKPPTQQQAQAAASSNLHYSQQARAVILPDSAMVQQWIPLPQSQQQQQQARGGSNDSVSLVYISSRASEFMSTINMQLTPTGSGDSANSPPTNNKQLSDELKQIHLKIVIEGILFEQTFEPQLNLSFTYAWNRRNVYRQKSFGLSTAAVSVGYEYFDCKQVIWTTKHLQLAGHELAISDIGDSWNLNIHHRYNYRENILQRGDGANFNLKLERPRMVVPVMGDGYPRQTVCPFCDGATAPVEQKLLRPQALVSAPDGSLYVGDFNLIRRIEPPPPPSVSAGGGGLSAAGQQAERVVRTVLELPAARVPQEGYALALNLAPGGGDSSPRLYMTDPERRQVYLVREPSRSSGAAADATSNETTPPSGGGPNAQQPATWEEALVPVAGTGQRCPVDDALSCGDRQAALAARLIEPKALAFDLAGRMYLADGPNVRLVDTDQRIYTLLGDYSPASRRHHTKFPCTPGEAIPMHKFVPKWPLDLAFNPLDETLHVLDENIVYKITQDKRVQVVAGRPAHCRSGESSPPLTVRAQQQQHQRASETYLRGARSIAFNQNGHLFIGEEGASGAAAAGSARVLVVSPEDDSIAVYAGGRDSPAESSAGPEVVATTAGNQASASKQHRLSNALLQASGASAATARASDYKFHSVAGLALDQRGNLVVADKMALRVVSVEPDLPQMNALTGEYEIQSPDEPAELLVFNRHGHHVATRELLPVSSSPSAFPSAVMNSQQQQQQQKPQAINKYTFTYNVNTSFGQLASVSYASGNRISIYRDGPQHGVKMIETAYGGQCKLDIGRSGQVHSIATMGAGHATKISMTYHIGGGLLRQSRDQASGETYNFVYDEFGRATAIQFQAK